MIGKGNSVEKFRSQFNTEHVLSTSDSGYKQVHPIGIACMPIRQQTAVAKPVSHCRIVQPFTVINNTYFCYYLVHSSVRVTDYFQCACSHASVHIFRVMFSAVLPNCRPTGLTCFKRCPSSLHASEILRYLSITPPRCSMHALSAKFHTLSCHNNQLCSALICRSYISVDAAADAAIFSS